MAKVLFIEPAMRNEKLGIMYLSAALKQAGHDTLLCCTDKEDIHDCMMDFEPDWLAVSLITGSHRKLLIQIKEIKKLYGVPVIVGGPHATFFPEEIGSDEADFVVVGQGERAIVDIVERNARTRIVQYPLADLDAMPFPDRELIYRFREFRDNPMKNIITCRDCPYSCSYCYNHTWKQKFKSQKAFLQRRRVEDVVAEAKELKKNYLLKKILFIDDNFLIKTNWIEEFCHKYKKNINLPFVCSFSVNLLDKKILSLLKDAGLCTVNFALESADPNVQKEILCRNHVNNKHIISAVHLLRDFGIKARMQNMIGLPLKDSLQDALNTLAFNRKHHVDDSWVSIFQPYPNTRLAKYCEDNGFMADGHHAFATSFFNESGLKLNARQKIRRLQKWWYFIIHYNLPDSVVSQLLDLDLNASNENDLQTLRFQYSRNYLYGLEGENRFLEHNWKDIETKYATRDTFTKIRSLVRRYRLSNGLTEIMMNMAIPEPFIVEHEDVSNDAKKDSHY